MHLQYNGIDCSVFSASFIIRSMTIVTYSWLHAGSLQRELYNEMPAMMEKHPGIKGLRLMQNHLPGTRSARRTSLFNAPIFKAYCFLLTDRPRIHRYMHAKGRAVIDGLCAGPLRPCLSIGLGIEDFGTGGRCPDVTSCFQLYCCCGSTAGAGQIRFWRLLTSRAIL